MIRFISILFFFPIFSFSWASAGELVVAAYDSLISKGGLGPVLATEFEKQSGSRIRWIRVGDSGQLFNRLQIEEQKKDPRIHVVLGVDLVSSAQFKDITQPKFIPFDWGWFVFLMHSDLLKVPPRTVQDLVSPQFSKKWVVQDPRMSTPGLQFFLATENEAVSQEFWKKASQSWFMLAPSWDSAYAVFQKKQVALVWTYGTSLAYERTHGDSSAHEIQSLDVFRKSPIQVEGVMVARSVKPGTESDRLAQKFIEILLSPAIQKTIPSTQWMMPIVKNTELPESYRKLKIPVFEMPLQPAEDEIPQKLKRWRAGLE